MAKKTIYELTAERHNLYDKIDSVDKQIEDIRNNEAIEEYKPISLREFYDYMIDFAKYTMEQCYEPWEFSGQDMPGIIKMALRARIRPDDPNENDSVLLESIHFAD